MIRISVPKIQTSRPFQFSLGHRDQSGFTLIEILVVVGLIAMVMAFAVPQAGMALKINITNSTRELATTIRSMHDEAVLKGGVYRLALDIERGQYWVESGDRDFLMRSQEQEELERRRNERRTDDEKAKHKEPFALAASVTKKKLSLPAGIKFTDIQVSRSKEPVTAGVVYAHAFPHGFVEKLVVHVKDSFDRESTLIVNSVTGKSRVYERYVKETD